MESHPLKPVAAALLASVGGEEDGRAGIESWGSGGSTVWEHGECESGCAAVSFNSGRQNIT